VVSVEAVASGRRDRRPLSIAALCDLDGTLCKLVSRKWWEYEACGRDVASEPIKVLLRLFGNSGYEIVLVTGRPETYREHTEAWLEKNGIEYSELIMRNVDDRTSNADFKQRVIDEHVTGKRDVILAIDDNPRTVRMFRANGIVTLDVGSDHSTGT
jgi:phosphoglycolate phosphatase-like HAD superfamily hydrolase